MNNYFIAYILYFKTLKDIVRVNILHKIKNNRRLNNSVMGFDILNINIINLLTSNIL